MEMYIKSISNWRRAIFQNVFSEKNFYVRYVYIFRGKFFSEGTFWNVD